MRKERKKRNKRYAVVGYRKTPLGCEKVTQKGVFRNLATAMKMETVWNKAGLYPMFFVVETV